MSRRAERWRCECRWAWLNLRARGWRAGLAIALLAVALGANAIVFSAADSIVFHRTPFADAGRLMEMHQRDQPNAIVSETFATRYWLNESAAGHSYRRCSSPPGSPRATRPGSIHRRCSGIESGIRAPFTERSNTRRREREGIFVS